MKRSRRGAAYESPPEISETGELMIRALDSMASFDAQLARSRRVAADVKKALARRTRQAGAQSSTPSGSGSRR